MILSEILSIYPHYYKLQSFNLPPLTLVLNLSISCQYPYKIVLVFFISSHHLFSLPLFIFTIHLPYLFFRLGDVNFWSVWLKISNKDLVCYLTFSVLNSARLFNKLWFLDRKMAWSGEVTRCLTLVKAIVFLLIV